LYMKLARAPLLVNSFTVQLLQNISTNTQKKHGLTLRKIDHDKFLAIVSKVLTEGNGSFRLENNPF